MDRFVTDHIEDQVASKLFNPLQKMHMPDAENIECAIGKDFFEQLHHPFDGVCILVVHYVPCQCSMLDVQSKQCVLRTFLVYILRSYVPNVVQLKDPSSLLEVLLPVHRHEDR
ncbi:MAG: hypothetical protein ABDK94_09665 [Atribacterota bacterium]